MMQRGKVKSKMLRLVFAHEAVDIHLGPYILKCASRKKCFLFKNPWALKKKAWSDGT